MKQLTIQFPTQELRTDRPKKSTKKSKQPITWDMSPAEASLLSEMLTESLYTVNPWGGGAA